MKLLFTALTFLVIGFIAGWLADTKKKEIAVSDDMRQTLEAISQIVGPMDKEEVEELLLLIQNFNKNAVQELDQMNLWRAVTANQLLALEKEKGIEAAKERANYLIANFRESYEEGMRVGNWTEMADMLYKNTEPTSEPDGVLNTETPP